MFSQNHPMIMSLLEIDKQRDAHWALCLIDRTVIVMDLFACYFWTCSSMFVPLILPSNRMRKRGRQAEMNNDTVKKENPLAALPIQQLDSSFTNIQYSQSTDMRIGAQRLIMCSAFRIWEVIFTQKCEVRCVVLDITELEDS